MSDELPANSADVGITFSRYDWELILGWFHGEEYHSPHTFTREGCPEHFELKDKIDFLLAVWPG